MLNLIKRWISRFWLLVFFALIFTLMAKFKISFKDLVQTALQLKYWQLYVILLLFAFIACLEILLRRFLLSGYAKVCSVKTLGLIHFSTMAAHYSTPVKIGFPLTVYLLNKFENIPYSVGSAIVLIELFASLFVCGLIAVFGMLFYFENLSVYLVLFIVVSLVVLVVMIKKKRLNLSRYKGLSKITDFLLQVVVALSTLSFKRAFLYLVFFFLIRAVGSLNLYLLTIFLAENITFLQALFSGSTAFFIGAMSMIPMGLGARDVSMLFLLNHFGVTHETGMIIVSIQRVLFTGVSFLLGVISGSWLGIKKPGNFKDKIVSNG